ncbi:MAG: hypothetical protein A3D52_01700 [Candidatus Taylorbacteria bacterium RIFCSPHIGHO2_02_FULL_44_36]|uniref:Uncharacterized protein n=1 Tax=Candidatus Taylorbacteria bacterium RIFCSPLOWO2_12_FULL_44_15c TaxID=1802333 RepID=A0A1G2P841_9BACT|nr:MAG: hypothetical protein A3D52_01700 [Candidatus Taylorbacteria bacterium RIFCSPHIGHO2_02_FULL_44_36]OHA38605.1 MAG: hypothetical protein A3I97_01070 [Candidatus Taylorbacteria bacterium RIFCSPLOWO2_02_FULL_44_35]OHA43889.1 MAG: hypothetical protein A3G03_01100 [Candidatus Taylorbacteria bacterium RIFCSPLOWO2_12_FULL_44_15c]
MKEKYREIASALMESVERRYGVVKVIELRQECGAAAKEGLARETTCQIIARLPCWSRLKFLILYPELILPYLFRI